MKRLAVLTAAVVIAGLPGTGCKKKEPPPTPPPAPQGMQAPGMPSQAGAPHGLMGGGPEKKVIVPDSVKGAWKAVKVEVEYKQKKSKKAFAIALNSDFKIPDSDLTLKVGDFLPHFAMTADSITSASNNLENPAVRIEVLEGGKSIFKGWLFSKYPAVHPFQHDKYGLTLVEAAKK